MTTQEQNKVESTNKMLILLVGLLIGFMLGFAFSDTINGSQNKIIVSNTPTKLLPVSGKEKLPDNHPKIDELEKQVKEAIDFGSKNQDYDSQLKVGTFLYLQARMIDEAKPFLIKAQQLKPSEFDVLVKLGSICFDQAREKNDPAAMQESVKWYEKAIKIRPEDASLLTDIGIAYQYISPANHKKAIEYFDITLSKDPQYLPALYNKTRSYIALKNVGEAEKTLNSFREFTNNGQNESAKEMIQSLENEVKKLK
jgi:tetratricopeptide (TPR) repeat protein